MCSLITTQILCDLTDGKFLKCALKSMRSHPMFQKLRAMKKQAAGLDQTLEALLRVRVVWMPVGVAGEGEPLESSPDVVVRRGGAHTERGVGVKPLPNAAHQGAASRLPSALRTMGPGVSVGASLLGSQAFSYQMTVCS